MTTSPTPISRILSACTAFMILATASCGTSPHADVTPETTSNSTQGTRLASSLTERINQVLDYDKHTPSMAKDQIDALHRALDHDGVVSRTDYEQAHQRYVQCVVAKGYTAPPNYRYGTGLYPSSTLSTYEGHTFEEYQKFSQDNLDCYQAHFMNVNELYRMAIGNQDLLQDPTLGTIDCLHRANLVPTSYTSQQYQQERDDYLDRYGKELKTDPQHAAARAAEAFTFDMADPDAVTCLVANGWDIELDDVTPWKPWGD